MSLVVTLRPSATSSSTGWTAVPSGTLHGVTSDNSDSTYALWSGAGAPLVLQTPLDSPGAGLRRHQVRVRARGQLGDAWWGVRLQSGALTAGATRQFPVSPETSIGSWGFGAPPDGGTILAAHIEGQSTALRINEIFLDVDFRSAPTFTAQTIDGSGTVTTAITDTATPTLHAEAINLDGLPARQFRYWVTQGSVIVFDTGIVSGQATDTLTSPLANGSYVAHLRIWTTLGDQHEYASLENTVAFTVSVGQVQRPNDPIVEQVPDSPLYDITVCAPDVRQLDGDVGYVEIQRVGCVESDNPDEITIAMLGPLATDQCATYTDYSVPRTGLPVDSSCDHPNEACCSYYRARTIGRIGGSVVISTWSDATDAGLPSGLIFFWPGTNASVPAGWTRQTALDAKYLKGAAADQQPGTLGGAVSHTHALLDHNHSVSHTHTVPSTAGAVGTATTGPNTAGINVALSSHTHAIPDLIASINDSGSTTPSVTSVNNDTERLSVIMIESTGSPAGVPNGALGLTTETSITGWTDYANADGRYLKGAAAAGNGGATAAGTLANHTHTLGAHTHAGGTAHNHGGAGFTGQAASTVTPTTGATVVMNTSTHSHTYAVASANTAALDSASGGVSDPTSAGTNEPPFINVRVKENTSGSPSIPVGIIGAWRGSLGTIPEHFALCDGTNGTPDLRGRHPKGATASIGTTGGSAAAHTHTTPTHTHAASAGHTHSVSIDAAALASLGRQAVATITVATATHSHAAVNTSSTVNSVTPVTAGTLPGQTAEPPHEEVAFVQLVEPFIPNSPPAPICLEWTDDEHLIRTAGPDGASWVPVIGKFTWARDRPFSSAMGVNGTMFADNAAPGGRNLIMRAAVESEDALQDLLAVLSRPLVLISPSDSYEVWAAPIAASVRVVKVARGREVSAEFIGTGPQPGPQVADI